MLDILDRDVAPSYPRVHLGDERFERSRALDACAHGVVQLGLGGKRLDQRIRLPGHQTVEVGHRHKLVQPPFVLEPRKRRRGEQLGEERHPTSVPHPI
jgi:hypothetical protein